MRVQAGVEGSARPPAGRVPIVTELQGKSHGVQCFSFR